MKAQTPSKRLLLLIPTTTYRADPFLEAVRRMDLDVVVGSDFCRVLADDWDVPLSLRLRYVSQPVEEIVAYAREHTLDAIIPVDDYTTEIATRACKSLGLPHNAPEAAVATRNKYCMREMLSAAGEWCPYFTRFDLSVPVEAVAPEQPYPCVLKPVLLSGSRGVIRAGSPAGFIEAFRRIGRILNGATDRPPSLGPDARPKRHSRPWPTPPSGLTRPWDSRRGRSTPNCGSTTEKPGSLKSPAGRSGAVLARPGIRTGDVPGRTHFAPCPGSERRSWALSSQKGMNPVR